MANLNQWLKDRTEKDKDLYKEYGKPLESKHKGEYVAIGPSGETVIDKKLVSVLEKAVKTFGSGNFGLARIGYSTFGKWLLQH